MAWFDRNDASIPEELRDLDKDALVAAVKFHKEHKDKLPQVESELATTKQTLDNVTNEFTETKRRLAELEANSRVNPPKKEENPPQNQPRSWLEDPDGAFVDSVKPLVEMTMNQGTILAQMRLETHLAGLPGDQIKIYKKYQPEIIELLKRESPANQANPQAWFNAFTLVKGLHMEEIAEARAKNDAAFFGETPKPNTPENQDKGDQVTEHDKSMAKKYGMTPEEVLAARKGMTYETEIVLPR